MKRILLLLIMSLIVLIWAFAGCKKNGNPTTVRPTIPDSKNRNIGDDGTAR